MSVFVSSGSGFDSIDAAVTTGCSPAAVVSADITCKMPPALSPTVAFNQHSISLDSTGQHLRLRQDTQLHLNLETQEFDVDGWGIRMNLSDVGNLPREMARQYLRLWSNSERGRLRGDERSLWGQRVERVDVQAFCNNRAPFTYTEGEVVGRTREGTLVRWADEREEMQHGKRGRAFDMLNIGELFSASVKLDGSGKIREVENVTFLGSAEELLHEVDDDWIQKG